MRSAVTHRPPFQRIYVVILWPIIRLIAGRSEERCSSRPTARGKVGFQRTGTIRAKDYTNGIFIAPNSILPFLTGCRHIYYVGYYWFFPCNMDKGSAFRFETVLRWNETVMVPLRTPSR